MIVSDISYIKFEYVVITCILRTSTMRIMWQVYTLCSKKLYDSYRKEKKRLNATCSLNSFFTVAFTVLLPPLFIVAPASRCTR